jgi:hypothetical protein
LSESSANPERVTEGEGGQLQSSLSRFFVAGFSPEGSFMLCLKAPLARVEREPRAGCEIVTLDNCSVKGNCHFLRFRIILFHQWHCASLTVAVRRAPIICPLFYKLLELFGRFAKSA